MTDSYFPRYVEMCLCSEVQYLHGPEVLRAPEPGDTYWKDGMGVIHVSSSAVRVMQSDSRYLSLAVLANPSPSHFSDERAIASVITTTESLTLDIVRMGQLIWLPSEQQIADMILGMPYWEKLAMMVKWAYGAREWYRKFDSGRELWLAYWMSVTYGKRWNFDWPSLEVRGRWVLDVGQGGRPFDEE